MSGGAAGADLAWGVAADGAGHNVVHWTFVGHKAATNEFTVVLPRETLDEANEYLLRASKNLKRRWPGNNPYTNDLMRRNYFQVAWSHRVYALSRFQKDSSLLGIKGGTAWACQCYVDRWYNGTNLTECELYLFDLDQNCWMQ